MALTKTTVEWPLVGGLDTKRSPVALAPGSNLLAQDVRQERLGEWRRRDGFSNAAADTMPEAAPYFVGPLGDSGLLEYGQAGLSVMSPSLSSSKWSTPVSAPPPTRRTRRPLIADDFHNFGFARAGNLIGLLHSQNGTSVNLDVIDASSSSLAASAALPIGSGQTSFRGSATSTKILMVASDFDGTCFGSTGIFVYVIDVATAAVTGPTKIKAGAFWDFDVNYYGGATISIVVATLAGVVTLLEYNPATGALATNTVVGGLTAYLVRLLADPDASGVRFIAASFSTPTTRVVRCDSAAAVLSNDQAEAIESTMISGVASNAGANWNIIYRTTTPNLRIGNKTAGVVATAAFQGSATWGTSAFVDSQAWREPNISGWSVLLGLHSQDPADPQDTWVEMFMPIGASSAAAVPVSTPVPLSASASGLQTYQVVRTAPYRFSFALPVQVVYEDNAGAIVRHYSIDLFEQTYLTSADLAGNATGPPVPYGQSAFFPTGQVSFYDGGILRPLGTRTPPRILTVTPSVAAGLLTGSAQYQYLAVIEQIDADGNVWRSPPSEPTILTMSAAQNTNTIVYSSWALEPNLYYRLVLFRTAADGSAFRRIFSKLFAAGPAVTYVDLLSDDQIIDGDFVYTTGEIPTAITPPASALALSGGRQWLIDADYPNETRYSKKLRPGRLPEYNDVMVATYVDEFGPFTNVADLDGKTLLFKAGAVYLATGEGLDDAGGGTDFVIDRIATDMGAIVGSPVFAIGQEAYFVSERGICKVAVGEAPSFIGSPVDRFLHQPQIQTPETARAIVYVPKWDEIRFVTNASVLVYNRTFAIWTRWVGGLATGSPLAHSVVIGGRQWVIREDGKIFVEGDASQLTDGTVDFPGYLRSQWVTPANADGRLRLYRGRAKAIRTAGGSAILPQLSLFFDYDEDNRIDFDPPAPILGTDLSVDLEGSPHVTEQTCSAFSEQITFPSGDNTWRIERWSAVVGIKPGFARNVQQWER